MQPLCREELERVSGGGDTLSHQLTGLGDIGVSGVPCRYRGKLGWGRGLGVLGEGISGCAELTAGYRLVPRDEAATSGVQGGVGCMGNRPLPCGQWEPLQGLKGGIRFSL